MQISSVVFFIRNRRQGWNVEIFPIKKLAKPEQAIKKQEIMTAEGLICYWNLFNHKSLWLKTLHSSALHLKQQII